MPGIRNMMATPTPTSLKPQFFVCRPDGKQVPLIAMDEVPTNVVFHGVSRTLEARETVGMTSVGEYPSRHLHYHVEFAAPRANPFDGLSSFSPAPNSHHSLIDVDDTVPATSSQHESMGPFTSNKSLLKPAVDTVDAVPIDRSLLASKYAPPTNRSELVSKYIPPIDRTIQASDYASAGLTMENGYPAPPLSFSIDVPPSSAGTIPKPNYTMNFPSANGNESQNFRSTSPSTDYRPSTTTSPARPIRRKGVKTHCTFWMLRGECAFVQQGCNLKHEMPLDAEGLAECGFTDIPRWYRNQYGIPSILAEPGSGAAGGPANISIAKKEKMQDNWRTSDDVRNHGPFTDSEGTPARSTPRSRPGSAKQGRYSTPNRNFGSPRPKRNNQPVITIPDLTLINAIGQMNMKKAEEADRKANVSARIRQPSAVEMSSAVIESRPTSSGTDSLANRSDSEQGAIPTAGHISPITSCESDAETVTKGPQNSKAGLGKGRRRAPVSNNTQASPVSSKLTGYRGAQASGHKARGKSLRPSDLAYAIQRQEAAAAAASPKQSGKQTTTSAVAARNGTNRTPVASGSGKTTDGKQVNGGQAEVYSWSPGGYNHDD